MGELVGLWDNNPLFSQFTRLFVTIGLAWITVAAIRFAVTNSESRPQALSTEAAWAIVKDGIRAGAQILVLRILLPTTAVIAVVQGHAGNVEFARMFLIGFFVAVLLFFVFWLLYALALQKNAIWHAGAAASMGGGNRGLAALLLLASIIYSGPDAATELEAAKTAFLAVDMGNFIALLVAFPLMTSLLVRARTIDDETPLGRLLAQNIVGARWDLIPFLVAALAVVVLSAWPHPILTAAVDQIGRETENIRSLLLLYLAWMYVFVTLPSLRSVSGALGEATLLLVSRLGLAAAALFTGAFLLTITWSDFFRTPEGLALTVLLIAPVSSFAPFIATRSGAPEEAEARITRLVLASTMLFFVLSIVLVGVLLAGVV